MRERWTPPKRFVRPPVGALTTPARANEIAPSAEPIPPADHPSQEDADRGLELITELVSAGHAEALATALEVVWASTRELGAQPGNAGLIHGDLHQQNYLFKGSDAQAIDFDDCGWGFFLHDLAVTLSELEGRPRYGELRAALLDEYTGLRPLPRRAETHLEAFGTLRRMTLLMWVVESRDHPAFRDDCQAWTRELLRDLAAAVKRGPLAERLGAGLAEFAALCERAFTPAGRVVAGSGLRVVPMLKRERRPARGEVDEAALALLARHGPQILATARRYAATPEDAEDAYQRALEILLTKAPTTQEQELVPWLKTVVKHEAFALRRQRERHSPVTDDGELGDRGTPAAATHDQAERMERLHQGAEALRRLKPQEMRALLLKAEGYSYAEIGEITGWSYTKVNRCLTEGRRALSVRLAGIEGGIECAKLASQLSALADGEASTEELRLLRPHLKTCLSCRARLKEFRAAPARVAALVPPVAVVAATSGGTAGLLESLLGGAQQRAESILGAAQQKAAVLGERAHAAAELATGQKVAAAAASAAALAGGGTAVDQLAGHEPPAPAAQQQAEVKPKPVKQDVPVQAAPEPAPVPQAPVTPEPAPEPLPAPQPAPEPPPPPPPDPAHEFDPTTAAAPATQPAPPPVATAQPAGGGFSPGGGGPGAGGGGGSGSEFGP